jgi:hypothetical protein
MLRGIEIHAWSPRRRKIQTVGPTKRFFWHSFEKSFKNAKRGIFPAVLSIKYLVKLFSAYTREEKPKIVASSSFSRRSMICQIILKITSASPKKLLHWRSCFRSHLGEAEVMPNEI